MILDDKSLLLRYVGARDAEAFSELVQRYSTMVYSVACRVTGNAAAAEDVTQDCFLTLARQADTVRGSLPAWLHRVALTRSLKVVRSNSTRQKREATVSALSRTNEEPTWNEIVPLVDAALAELPEDLRECLVQHFLLGRPQTQVAENLGISRATVARRLTDGIETVRRHLKKSGMAFGAVALATALAEQTSAAVPAQLSITLAKMAIAGPIKASTAGTLTTVLGANVKIITAVVAAVVGVGALSYHFVPGTGLLGSSTTGSKVRPYLSKLDLRSDVEFPDSFSLTFQAAARLYGREAGYDTIYALSTNAFCPAVAIDMPERKSNWHVQARLGDNAISTLGARYGLAVRDLRQPDAGDDAEAYRRLVAPGITEAMDAGSVVVITSGWHANNIPMQWHAGIVTDAQLDGSASGVTPRGRSDCQFDSSSGIWALSRGTETMTPNEADVATLHAAIARIRGRVPYKTTKQSVYGLAAMDGWIQAMNETAGFCSCEVCQVGLHDSSVRRRSAAYANVSVTRVASRVAAAYLRKISQDFPAAAQPHIESAAGHYDRIVALLAPATGTGPDSYEAFIGDLARQKVHAAKVLVPVKAEYAAIADDLERALKAE